MGIFDKLRAELIDITEWVDDGRTKTAALLLASSDRSRTSPLQSHVSFHSCSSALGASHRDFT